MAGKRQKRPEELQGYGSRYRGQRTIYLEPRVPAPLVERERALDVAIAQIERQFASGGKEPVSAAKSEVAQLRPRDEPGRFLPVEGEKIVASERKPRKRRTDPAPEPATKRKRRRRKSQASLIREEMRARGQWPAGR